MIVFPKKFIENNDLANTRHLITAVISSIEASEQTGQDALDLQFRKVIEIRWLESIRPTFSIVLPTEDSN